MIKKIKLPKSGFTVELEDSIGIGIFRGYQQLMMKDAKIDLTSQKSTQEIKLGLDSVYRGQDYVLKNILLAIYDKDGNKLEPALEKFKELPPQDGNLVYDEVDKIIASMSMKPVQKKSGKKPVSSGLKT